MYDFILNMWTLKKITEETVNSYVPRFITAEQAAEIIATPQTGWIGGGGSSGGGTDPELAQTVNALKETVSTMNDTIKQQGESITKLQGDVKKEKDVTDALLGIEETEESEVTE